MPHVRLTCLRALALACLASCTPNPVPPGNGGFPPGLSPENSTVEASPASLVADGVATSTVTVVLKDQGGVGVKGLTVALTASGTSNTVSPASAVSDDDGKATFSLRSTKAEAKQVQATVNAAALPQTATVTFIAGPAKTLRFSVQPTNAVSAQAVSPAIEVSAVDAFDNLATAMEAPVTLAFATLTAGATLAGTTTQSAVAGIARFDDVSIKRAGAYRLNASSAGLTSATSDQFLVSTAGAVSVKFIVGPSTTVAGLPVAPAMTVSVLDAAGNVLADATDEISLEVASGPAGGALFGTTSTAAVAGTATFGAVSLQKAGAYVLRATSGLLTPATSAAFGVTAGAAKSLSFLAQPQNGTAGQSLDAMEVIVVDAFSNLVTSSNASITLGVNTGPSLLLSGTLTQGASSGLSTFSGLSLTRAGAYTLIATSPGLTAAVSASFVVAPHTPTALSFAVPPANSTAGAPFAPEVLVVLKDAFGNNATNASGNVVLSVASGPMGSSVGGTASRALNAGLAAFDDVFIAKAGTYTVQASWTTLSATTAPFSISPAAVSSLTFVTPPSDRAAGATLSPSPAVALTDAFGNVVTTASSTVTLAVASGPSGATLTGTTSRATVSGVATFTGLSLTVAGAYTLGASATGFPMATPATSSAFTIAAASATKLSFTSGPPNGTAGQALPSSTTVSVLDTYNNVVTSSTASITLALAAGFPVGAVLSGTATRAAVAGVATFNDLSLNKSGGYTLTATSSSLTDATSAGFSIAAGAATKLAFSVPPSGADAGEVMTPSVVVSVLDALDNVAASSSASVTVALVTPPMGATLSGTTVRSASSGIATFNDLSMTRAGSYTLRATSSGLTATAGAAFTISPAGIATLAFTAQPTDASAFQSLSPAVAVTAYDAYSNVATNRVANVTLTVGSGPAGSTVGGTAVRPLSSGVATFTTLTLNKEGAYTLLASTPSVPSATSDSFNIIFFRILSYTTATARSQQGASLSVAWTTNAGNAAGGLQLNPGATSVSGMTSASVTPFASMPVGGRAYSRISEATAALNSEVTWARSLVGGATSHVNATGVAALPNGGYVVVGTFDGSVTVDGSTTYTSLGGTDALVVAFTSAGAVSWSRRLGSVGNETATGVKVTRTGAVLVSGTFTNTVSFGGAVSLTATGTSDGFAARFESSGTASWARAFGSVGASNAALAIDAFDDETVLVAGSFAGTLTTLGAAYNLGSVGNSDAFIARLSTDGSPAWTRRGGGSQADVARGVAATPDGRAVLVGSFTTTAVVPLVRFGALPNLTGNGLTDLFIVGYDANGTEAWQIRGGQNQTDVANAVSAAPDGSVLVVGSFMGVNNVMPGTTIHSAGGTDGFISKVSSTGTGVWSVRVGGLLNDSLLSVSALTDGSAALSGAFSSANASFGATVLTSSGASQDAFAAYVTSTGTVAWAKGMGGTLTDTSPGVAITTDGTVLAAGSFDGTATFESPQLTAPGTGTGLFVARVSPVNYRYLEHLPEGLSYARVGGSTTSADDLRGVAAFPDGSSIATGTFRDSMVIGSTTLVSSPANFDIFVLRYGADGALSWALSFGSTGNDDGYGVAALPDGSALVTGFFGGTVNFGAFSLTASGASDMFLMKINASGTVLWASRAGGPSIDRGASVSAWPDGSCLVAGAIGGTTATTFGTFSLTGNGSTDVFVAKFDPTGTVLWASRAGGTGADHANAVSVFGDGSAVIAGTIGGASCFGPNLSCTFNLSVNGGASTDAFLARVAADGTFAWGQSMGSTTVDDGWGVAAHRDGSSVISGAFTGTIVFDGTHSLVSAGSNDIFVAKYSPTGSVDWAVRHGSASGSEVGYAAAALPDGTTYVAGAFASTIAFGGTSLVSAGGVESFLAKFAGTDGAALWAKRSGGTSNDQASSVAVTVEGGALMGGTFQSAPATFGPGETQVVSFTTQGSRDSYLARYFSYGP